MAFVGQQLRQVALERSEHTHNRIAFDVRMFSDCICLIAEDSVIGAAALVDSVAYLSLTFANNRLLLRGGIARGRHFHSEDMVFSEALVEAYELESKIAKYPRTLVADSVAALARQRSPLFFALTSTG